MSFIQSNDSVEGTVDHTSVAPELTLSTSGMDVLVYARAGDRLITDVFRLSGGTLQHVIDETRSADYNTGIVGERLLNLESDQLDALALNDGSFGRAEVFYSGTSGFSGDRAIVLHTEIGGQSFYISAVAGQAGLHTFTRSNSGSLQQIQSLPDSATTYASDPHTMASWVSSTQTFVFVASQFEAGVTAYELGPDGSLTARDSLGATEGLGISQITQLLCLEVAGQPFLVLAAAGTGSLSILEIKPDGSLNLVDHVLDSIGTRFAGITMLEQVVINGVTYLLAAGQDDGLSLFTILPGGKLLHLESLADSYTTGLANINGMILRENASGFDIFVTSEQDVGLTHLSVDLGPGSGLIEGSTGADTLSGGEGTDQLIGEAGDDTLYGGAGQDILIGGAGDDHLIGGTGKDVFVLSTDTGHDTITDFVLGQDRIDVTAWVGLASLAQLDITAITGGAHIQYGIYQLTILTLNGVSLDYDDFMGKDVLGILRLPKDPDPPNDDGTSAADTLTGSAVSDTIYAYGGNDFVYGDDGQDTLDGGEGHDSLYGGAGDDHLYGGTGADQLFGKANNDTLYGGLGSDFIYGGDNNDTAYGGAEDDQIYGDAGHDHLMGDDGNDRLGGSTGADHLYGGAGDDSLTGDSSTDTLYGGRDDDHLAGGTGADVVYGGAGNDSLFGNTGVDTVYGNDGNDFISPGNGVDTVYGGGGHDHIIGRTGWDTIWGGSGDDSLFGSEGQDLLYGDSGADYLSGGFGYDLLFGGTGADRLYGNLGEDTLRGGDGNDLLFGATGNDALYGGDGDDTLFSSQGRDILEGGAGNDVMSGGSLNDRFLFGPGHGEDRITDFELVWDILSLDQDLWSDTLIADQVVAKFATVTNGDLIFDFGNGNTITLEGVTEISQIANDISFI